MQAGLRLCCSQTSERRRPIMYFWVKQQIFISVVWQNVLINYSEYNLWIHLTNKVILFPGSQWRLSDARFWPGCQWHRYPRMLRVCWPITLEVVLLWEEWSVLHKLQLLTMKVCVSLAKCLDPLGLVATKPVFGVSDKARFKADAQAGLRLCCPQTPEDRFCRDKAPLV